MGCLDDNTVIEFLDGLLAADAAVAVELHLDGCSTCRSHVSGLAGMPPVVTLTGSAEGTPLAAPHAAPRAGTATGRILVEPGATIGRYVVLRLLGRGGMGVVCTAYDPELDRNVALKVHRPDARVVDRGDERLRREAIAMARLNHPNVVTVFDVGAVGDQVFVAMELVDGTTLRRWRTGRSARAVLAACRQAGEGLAAAHAAGLVHRDVKPDNVLVARDGRVLLGDFGLALSEVQPDGTRAGTPPYMAPEQRSGRADARSDQYSFCAMVHEALFDELPRDPGDRGDPVRGGPRPGVTRALRRVLARGLSADPAARFPSLAPILDALRAAERRRRRWIAAGVIAAVAIAGTTVAVTRLAAPADARCTGGDAIVGATWNAGARAQLGRAFAATGLPYAPDAALQVGAALDRYARDWAGTHRRACEATWERGVQSPALLDARMRCLRVGLGRMTALVAALSATRDGRTIQGALDAVGGLPEVAACETSDAVAAAYPAPARPERAEAATLAIDRALAQDAAGATGEALTALRAAGDAVAAAHHPPLSAEYTYWLGELLRGTGDYAGAATALREAAALAAAAHHDELLARVWTRLVAVVGYHQKRADAAAELVAVAEAAVARYDASAALRATLDNNIGLVDMQAGRYDQAEARFRTAAAREGVRANERDKALSNLAVAQYRQGKVDEAVASFGAVVAAREEVYGPRHPLTATAHDNLGVVLGSTARAAEAEQHLVAALAIREAALGEGHPAVATSLVNLGTTLAERGDLVRAETYLRRALALAEADLPDSAEQVARVRYNLAMVARDRGQGAEALAGFEDTRARYEQVLGRDHPELIEVHVAIGEQLRRLGRPREAVAPLERALAIAEATAAATDPVLVADVRYALARVVPGRGRALALGRDARAAYAAAGDRARDKLAELTRWLAAR